MKLSKQQIEQLQRSAQNPGRLPRHAGPTEAAPPAREPEQSDRFSRAFEDALWAVESIRSGRSPGAPLPREKPAAVGAAPTADAVAVSEWRPVSSAPFDRDLEVRLSDGLGRYSLLYPCRLDANKGWVNALSGTALTADPIEWRDWKQKANDLQ
jgi:hypothetical protein